MAASNSDLEADLEDLITSTAENPVEEYEIRGRRVKRPHAHIDKMVTALLKLRGLQSSKRGVSVGQIDNAG